MRSQNDVSVTGYERSAQPTVNRSSSTLRRCAEQTTRLPDAPTRVCRRGSDTRAQSEYLNRLHHSSRNTEHAIQIIIFGDALSDRHMITLRIRDQIADGANHTRRIIYLRRITPADARSVSIMPDDQHKRSEFLLHHFSRFRSTQKIGAWIVIPLSGATTARACCGGS